MAEEIIQVSCPRLNYRTAMNLASNLKSGLFSKQSPPTIMGKILIKFVNGEPHQIMCPQYREDEKYHCNAEFMGQCVFSTWKEIHLMGDSKEVEE